jgi:hypothetical protein
MELGDEAMDLSLDKLQEGKWKYAHVHLGGRLCKAGGEVALGLMSR